MAILGIQTVENKDFAFSDFSPSGKGKLRTATRKDGDAASFSSDALKQLKDATGGAAEGLFGSVAKAKLGDGTDISYNNSTGAIKFGGATLQLGFKVDGEAFAKKTDNLTIGKNASNEIVVTNNSTNKSFVFGSDGKVKMDSVDVVDPNDPTKKTTVQKPHEATDKVIANALVLNRSGTSANGTGTASNVIINTAADASINGSSANDKIFNFSAKAMNINGNGGKDAVYSVGLNAGANINVGGNQATDMSYVKLLGNMKGGSVNLNGNTNMLDASGKTLTDVKVKSNDTQADTTTTAVVASSLTGAGAGIDLANDNAAVDLGRLNKGSVEMGAGNNSLTINSVTGDDTTKARITTKGTDTLNIKTINKATIDQSANKSSWMKLASSIANSTMTLGKGDNSLDASRATFNKTNITQDASATGSTSISGKSFMGDKDTKNSITLAGNGNSVSFSGTVSNANIALGTGSNTLDAGSLNNAIIKAGTTNTTSTESQTITVKGGAKNTTYTGSAGDDSLSFGGAVTDSSFDLGGGNNSIVASKTAKNGKQIDQNLTNVSIAATGEGTQNVVAKSLTTKKTGGVQGGSSINLSGTTVVSLSGTLGRNSKIGLGTGANSVFLGSVAGGSGSEMASISMGGSSGTSVSGNDQSLVVKNGVNRANVDMGGTGDITVVMGGNLSNSNVRLGNGDITMTLAKVGLKKTSYKNISNSSITTGSNSSTTLTAGGISGSRNTSTSLTLGNGDNKVSFAGSIGQNTTINLGTGSNTLDAKSITGTKSYKVNINVATSATQNSSIATTMNIHGGAQNLTYTGNQNADRLTFKGAITNALIDVDEGDNSLEATKTVRGKTNAQTLTNVEVRGASASGTNESSMTMNVGALKKGSKLNLQGNNSVTVGSVAAGTTLDLGVGSNTLTISKGITGTKSKQVTIQFGTTGTTNSQNVTINGNVSGLKYVGSDGDDNLTIKGKVSKSDIDLKGGVDNLRIINAKTSAGMSVTDTKISASGTSNVTAGAFNTTRNGSNDITLGHGTVSVGNISGRTTFTLGTGSTTMTMGSLSGRNVLLKSAGDGTFTATSIGAKATLDFSTSTAGNVHIVTTKGIGESTINMGSNALTIVTGTTAGATATAANANINGATINATNASSVNVLSKDIIGKTDMNLGGDATIAATKIGGSTNISGGTGSTTITADTIDGTNSGASSVTIDLSGMSAGSSGSLTVAKDATNFHLDMGNSSGTLAVSLGSVNQAKKTSTPGASVTATNAGSITMEIVGGSNRLTYTGSETGDDNVYLGGESKNSSYALGGGSNTVRGTDANTGASMTNSSITDSAGATTSVTLNKFSESGGGSSSILLQGNSGTVRVTGSLTGAAEINLNAKVSQFILADGATATGVSDKSRLTVAFGTAAGANHSFTIGGTVTNMNLTAEEAVTGSLTATKMENMSVLLKGAKNTLSMGSTNATSVKNMDISMGSDKASAANTLNLTGTINVDATKDKGLRLNFNGASGGSVISGAGVSLANTNITANQGDLTVNLASLDKSTVTQNGKGTNLNLNVTSSVSNLTVNTAEGGNVTVGSTTTTVNTTTVSGKMNELKILGKALNSLSVEDTGGTASVTLGGAATTTASSISVSGGSGTSIALTADSVTGLNVSKGGSLTVTADDLTGLNADVGSASLSVTNTGSNINVTASGTISLGGSSATLSSVNLTGGSGDTKVTAASLSGGSATLKGGNNSFTITNKLSGFTLESSGSNTTTAITGTGNAAGSLVIESSVLTNKSGSMDIKAVGMSGSTVNGEGGTVSATINNATNSSFNFTGGKDHLITSSGLLNNVNVTVSGSSTTATVAGTNYSGGGYTADGGKLTLTGTNMSGSTITVKGGGKLTNNVSNVTGGVSTVEGSSSTLNMTTTNLNGGSVVRGGDGTLNLTVTNVSGGTRIEGGKNANGTIAITSSLDGNSTVNAYAGKTAVSTVASGSTVDAKFTSAGGAGRDLLTVGTNEGSLSVSGGNLHIGINKATVNAAGSSETKIFDFSGGTMNLTGNATLDLKALTSGMINFNGSNQTNALTKFANGAGSTLGLSNFNVGTGTKPTAGLTTGTASTVAGTNYGSATDTI